MTLDEYLAACLRHAGPMLKTLPKQVQGHVIEAWRKTYMRQQQQQA
jgi:hypothetical protein